MALGAVIAVTAVLLVFQLGQARIFMVMSRDGLLPPVFARVHRRFRTPATATLLVGLFVAVSSSLLTPSQALELTSIGTLFAFMIVSIGVIALRIREPHRPRPFRCPGYPVTPVLSAVCCLWLMYGLPPMNWLRFGGWLLVGAVIYFAYGRRNSRLRAPSAA
jgi:basic amino acid/polyamine antiporter, APA family